MHFQLYVYSIIILVCVCVGVFVYTGDRNRSPAAEMTPVTNPKHHSEGRLVLGTAARARLQSQPGNFP